MSGSRQQLRTTLVAAGVATLTLLGLAPAHATPAGPRQPVAAARSASPSVTPARHHPGRRHPAVVRPVVALTQLSKKQFGGGAAAVLAPRAVAPAPAVPAFAGSDPSAPPAGSATRPPARSPPFSR